MAASKGNYLLFHIIKMLFNSRIRPADKYAALWPFLGICVEVVVLCTIIFIYEKKRNKAELEESDTDQSPEQPRKKPEGFFNRPDKVFIPLTGQSSSNINLSGTTSQKVFTDSGGRHPEVRPLSVQQPRISYKDGERKLKSDLVKFEIQDSTEKKKPDRVAPDTTFNPILMKTSDPAFSASASYRSEEAEETVLQIINRFK